MAIMSVTPQSISDAADIIKSGGIVGMPTETVYGLAADATNGAAVARVFEAKGRPQINPLIVHVANYKHAQDYVVVNDVAQSLADTFWPGPLTLILPHKKDSPIHDLVRAGLDTLAIRVPAHDVAQKLIRACGAPIAAPSANASGQPSTTSAKHVADSLGDKVDMILAAGMSEVGVESTVVDLSGDVPIILRPGGITIEMLRDVVPEIVSGEGDAHKPKSPGLLLKHYAPSVPVRLRAVDVRDDESLLAFGSVKFMGMTGGGAAANLPDDRIRNLSESGDLNEAARNLFAHLRELDNGASGGIAVMDIPEAGLGIAINDRLKRASQG